MMSTCMVVEYDLPEEGGLTAIYIPRGSRFIGVGTRDVAYSTIRRPVVWALEPIGNPDEGALEQRTLVAVHTGMAFIDVGWLIEPIGTLIDEGKPMHVFEMVDPAAFQSYVPAI